MAATERPYEEIDDETVIELAKYDSAAAQAEAALRGLTVPERYIAPIDNLSVEQITAGSSEFPDFIDCTEDIPVEQQSAVNLETLAWSGDADAAAELHKRYPSLYDEAGKPT